MKTNKCILSMLAFILIGISEPLYSQTYWNILGNSGTLSKTDFIGTTDNVGLAFRTKNVNRMFITTTGKVGIGTLAPAMKLDVNGNLNLPADSAIYFGTNKTIYANGINTVLGLNALFQVDRGSFNSAIGQNSQYSNAEGSYNISLGDYSLYSNDNGSENVAIGFQSLEELVGGVGNTAIGFNSMSGPSFGQYNTAVGANTFQRGSALGTAGETVCGYNGLHKLELGDDNTAIGFSALASSFIENNNTAIGYEADVNDSTNITNSTAVGSQTLLTAADQVRIGNNSVTSIGGYADWSNVTADGRVKKNIKQNVPGLAFINQLQPITYNLDLTAIDNISQRPILLDKNGKSAKPSQKELDARNAKEQMIYTGFTAQDVERAAQSLNYNFSGIDVAKNSKDLYGLRYSEFVVPLVKGEQELSAQNDSLKSLVNSMQTQIDEMESMMTAMANKLGISSAATVSSASLQQNVPNPCSNNTSIGYTLPQTFSSAQIIVSDNAGKTMKSINVSGAGNGTLNLDASTLAAGIYQYSLLVNGKLIDTKKMVLTK